MREVNQYVSEPVDGVPVGMIVMYAGLTIPTGWLLCDGTGYATSTYPALFAAIGTTYGSTNGFQVPSMNQRIAVGAGGTAEGALTSTDGAGVGITEAGLGRSIGSTGGHSSVTLTSAQSGLPSHTHQWTDTYRGYITTLGAGAEYVNSGQSEVTDYTSTTTASNASSSHTNIMPYMYVRYIIKAFS